MEPLIGAFAARDWISSSCGQLNCATLILYNIRATPNFTRIWGPGCRCVGAQLTGRWTNTRRYTVPCRAMPCRRYPAFPIIPKFYKGTDFRVRSPGQITDTNRAWNSSEEKRNERNTYTGGPRDRCGALPFGERPERDGTGRGGAPSGARCREASVHDGGVQFLYRRAAGQRSHPADQGAR